MVSALALVLTLAFPAELGIRDLMGLSILSLLCVFPAIVFAYILVFKRSRPNTIRITGPSQLSFFDSSTERDASAD